MTRDEAKKLLPIIEAFANGETIQLGPPGLWRDCISPDWSSSPENYRIKPKEYYVAKAVLWDKDGHKRDNPDYVKVREVLDDE